MKSSFVTRFTKSLRKPWYWWWHFVEANFYSGREYTLQFPFGHRILTPWFATHPETDFTRIFQQIKSNGKMIVSADRCYMLYQFANRSAQLSGDFAECGVYLGGTAQLLAQILSRQKVNKKLHLFDTFSGMPDSSIPERDYHLPGDFADTSLQEVQRRLLKYKDICLYYPGFMPDTFMGVEKECTFSFVHVDVDIYPSVLACCKWFWQRMTSGGIMVFDDYGFYPYRHAARLAVDEFFADQEEKPIVLTTGQAFVIKG